MSVCDYYSNGKGDQKLPNMIELFKNMDNKRGGEGGESKQICVKWL